MNLLEFARLVGDGSAVSRKDYVDLMRRVVPLDELRNLPPAEKESFHMTVAWLHDYSILLFEKAMAERGERPELLGSPWLPGASGPFIDHMLTRAHGESPDFTQLETFGVHDADDWLSP